MKIKTILTFGTALIPALSMAQAVHVWQDPNGWWDSHFTYVQNTQKFTAQELSLDLFGSYINPEERFSHLFQSNIHHGFWGGGVGLNYFITREFGLGGDINLSDHAGNIVDQVLGNGILRLPIESLGLAPYIFGGGGRAISPAWEWAADAGVGLELRLNPTTGIFVDGRYIWADESTDRLLLRAGFRLVF